MWNRDFLVGLLFLGFLELPLWEPWSVCKSHPQFQGEQLIQNFATYTNRYGTYVSAAWNRAKSRMRLVIHGLARTDVVWLSYSPRNIGHTQPHISNGYFNLVAALLQIHSLFFFSHSKKYAAHRNQQLIPLRIFHTEQIFVLVSMRLRNHVETQHVKRFMR